VTTFRVSAQPEQEKLKIGPRWLGLVPGTYLHFLGWNSYCFRSVRLNKVSVEFWPLFRDRVPPEQAKLITGPEWHDFAPGTYPHRLGYNFYRLTSMLLKTVLGKFWRLFRARAPLEHLKLKIEPVLLSFVPETNPHSFWCNSYCFNSVQLKNVSVEFWQISRPGCDRSRQSWKSGPKN